MRNRRDANLPHHHLVQESPIMRLTIILDQLIIGQLVLLGQDYVVGAPVRDSPETLPEEGPPITPFPVDVQEVTLPLWVVLRDGLPIIDVGTASSLGDKNPAQTARRTIPKLENFPKDCYRRLEALFQTNN